jgi:hypothetical protein
MPMLDHVGQEVNEIDIALGLLDILQALKFCHDDAHLIHGSSSQ